MDIYAVTLFGQFCKLHPNIQKKRRASMLRWFGSYQNQDDRSRKITLEFHLWILLKFCSCIAEIKDQMQKRYQIHGRMAAICLVRLNQLSKRGIKNCLDIYYPVHISENFQTAMSQGFTLLEIKYSHTDRNYLIITISVIVIIFKTPIYIFKTKT